MPVAIEIDALDPVSGERVTLRVAGGDDARLTGLNDERWWPALLRAPSLSKQAWDGDYTGEIEIGAAAFEVSLWGLTRLDPLAPRYRWAAAPVRIYAGAAGAAWAAWSEQFIGLVDGYDIEGMRLKLSAKVDTAPFEVPALTATWAGSGDAEGGDNLKNKPKPLALGRCKNVEPELLNATYNVYQVSAYAVNAIPMVYERAAEFTPTGTDYPDWASLIAATVDGGTFVTCLALGLFRLGAPPAGLITADVEGDNVSGYVRSTADVIQRLCDIAGVPSGSISATSLANLEADVPEPINFYLTEATPLLAVIQRLARPCNAQAGVSWLGKLYVARFGLIPPAPTLTIDAQARQLPPVISVAETAVSPPYWRIEMGGDRCWRVHSREEIATDTGAGVAWYTRSPTKPATPTDPAAEGWEQAPPQYCTHPTYGPIWSTTEADGSYSEPILTDSDYRGFVLQSLEGTALVETSRATSPAGSQGATPLAVLRSLDPIPTGVELIVRFNTANPQAAVGLARFVSSLGDPLSSNDHSDFGLYLSNGGTGPGWDSDNTAGAYAITEGDREFGGLWEGTGLSEYTRIDTTANQQGFELAVFYDGTYVYWDHGGYWEKFAFVGDEESFYLECAIWSPDTTVEVLQFRRAAVGRRIKDRINTTFGPWLALPDNGYVAQLAYFDDPDPLLLSSGAVHQSEMYLDPINGPCVANFTLFSNSKKLIITLDNSASPGGTYEGWLAFRANGDGTYSILQGSTLLAGPTAFTALRGQLIWNGPTLCARVDDVEVANVSVTDIGDDGRMHCAIFNFENWADFYHFSFESTAPVIKPTVAPNATSQAHGILGGFYDQTTPTDINGYITLGTFNVTLDREADLIIIILFNYMLVSGPRGFAPQIRLNYSTGGGPDTLFHDSPVYTQLNVGDPPLVGPAIEPVKRMAAGTYTFTILARNAATGSGNWHASISTTTSSAVEQI